MLLQVQRVLIEGRLLGVLRCNTVQPLITYELVGTADNNCRGISSIVPTRVCLPYLCIYASISKAMQAISVEPLLWVRYPELCRSIAPACTEKLLSTWRLWDYATNTHA